MARPLSDDKRSAILAAAATIVSQQGAGAPTAKIAKEAGVAEGSLFTYFANKDVLFNELYLSIKDDLRIALIKGYPGNKSIKDRCKHVWDRSIDFGVAHPDEWKSIQHLGISGRLTDATKKAGSQGFQDIEEMIQEGFSSRVLRKQPVAFVGGIMEALSEMVLNFVVREPAKVSEYKRAGFEAFWGAIAER
jgi:AcrR family transcriptional regulator